LALTQVVIEGLHRFVKILGEGVGRKPSLIYQIVVLMYKNTWDTVGNHRIKRNAILKILLRVESALAMTLSVVERYRQILCFRQCP